MGYERIHKSQSGGIISPSKLRVKLMGVTSSSLSTSAQKKKEGSNCNSSRTSPSKLADSDFINSLLASSNHQDFDDTVTSLDTSSVDLTGQTVSNSVERQNNFPPKENMNVKVQQVSRGDSGNSSAVHPLKLNEDESLDYDSNASSSSFEFHKGERVGHHRSLTRSLSRPTSYKWNDAEKWIMNKHTGQANNSNTTHGGHSTGNRMVRVAPEVSSLDNRFPIRALDTRRFDSNQHVNHMNVEKFNLPVPLNNVPVDLFPLHKDLTLGNVENVNNDTEGTTGIRAISMRDMGTEMTPATSQEPSRTATPVGATTPLRSPTSSIPSTPRAESATTHVECGVDNNNPHPPQDGNQKGDKQLSEQDLKLKTRQEIVALGVRLGKMNIAAWASTDDKDKHSSPKTATDPEELERIENEKRAAEWEEAEKTKHAARYKREEIKIQAWESQQKAKLEEELRRIEAKVEKLRMESRARMEKKIGVARKTSEEKRAVAEARKQREAEKTAAQAEYIRQTGRIPSSDYYSCCGLFT